MPTLPGTSQSCDRAARKLPESNPPPARYSRSCVNTVNKRGVCETHTGLRKLPSFRLWPVQWPLLQSAPARLVFSLESICPCWAAAFYDAARLQLRCIDVQSLPDVVSI